MRTTLLILTSILFYSCSEAQKPTVADVTNTLKSSWENEATSFREKNTITINSIKFGISEKSNYAQQLEGVPKGALITHTKIDFTQNQFYTNQTRQVRRIMTAWVYKNQFDEWAVMNVGTIYPQ